jgi:hypothetical protein
MNIHYPCTKGDALPRTFFNRLDDARETYLEMTEIMSDISQNKPKWFNDKDHEPKSML